jgi:hypothetical protein
MASYLHFYQGMMPWTPFFSWVGTGVRGTPAHFENVDNFLEEVTKKLLKTLKSQETAAQAERQISVLVED